VRGQHREFLIQEKAIGKAKMSQGNFKRTSTPSFRHSRIRRKGYHPCPGKSDFYRLCQGLHDNPSNAAYAKCATAAEGASIAWAKHAVTW
jgi:hypothetical protein